MLLLYEVINVFMSNDNTCNAWSHALINTREHSMNYAYLLSKTLFGKTYRKLIDSSVASIDGMGSGVGVLPHNFLLREEELNPFIKGFSLDTLGPNAGSYLLSQARVVVSHRLPVMAFKAGWKEFVSNNNATIEVHTEFGEYAKEMQSMVNFLWPYAPFADSLYSQYLSANGVLGSALTASCLNPLNQVQAIKYNLNQLVLVDARFAKSRNDYTEHDSDTNFTEYRYAIVDYVGALVTFPLTYILISGIQRGNSFENNANVYNKFCSMVIFTGVASFAQYASNMIIEPVKFLVNKGFDWYYSRDVKNNPQLIAVQSEQFTQEVGSEYEPINQIKLDSPTEQVIQVSIKNALGEVVNSFCYWSGDREDSIQDSVYSGYLLSALIIAATIPNRQPKHFVQEEILPLPKGLLSGGSLLFKHLHDSYLESMFKQGMSMFDSADFVV